MKPRGSLMIEHRLIEKVLKVAERRARSLAASEYDPVFVETIVDFVRTYADRTHHGKEEDILFAELQVRQLDKADAAMMADLVEEHRQARSRVKRVVELNAAFRRGDVSVVPKIAELVLWLAAFYPVHIRKEDREFDRNMIHEKYRAVYEAIRA